MLKYAAGGAIAGFDIPTILSMSHALGYDGLALAFLLEFAEEGLREAVQKHGNSNAEYCNPDNGS